MFKSHLALFFEVMSLIVAKDLVVLPLLILTIGFRELPVTSFLGLTLMLATGIAYFYYVAPWAVRKIGREKINTLRVYDYLKRRFHWSDHS